MPKKFTLTSLNPGCPPYRQLYCSVGSRNTWSTTKYAVMSRSTTQVVPFELPPCYLRNHAMPRLHQILSLQSKHHYTTVAS